MSVTGEVWPMSLEYAGLTEGTSAFSCSAEELHRCVVALLVRAGLMPSDAEIVASNIVEAEARGVASHGLILLPVYVERIRAGGIKPSYTITTVRDTGPIILLDGGGGPGQVLATHAVSLAVNRAQQYGIAYIGLRNSNHVGMLATYGLQAARAGLVAVVMTNSGPSVSVARGRGKRLGNNALCVAVPTQSEPFVFDMATGTVACGKIRLAAMDQKPIPEFWLQDRDGHPSQDPLDLDRGGGVLPLGGYKGYGLATAVDILTALVSGGAPSYNVLNQRAATGSSTGASQAFAVFDPEVTIGRENLRQAVSEYVATLRQSVPVDEKHPVLAPGDPELEAVHRATLEGISLTGPVFSMMDSLCNALGVPSLTK